MAFAVLTIAALSETSEWSFTTRMDTMMIRKTAFNSTDAMQGAL